MSAHLYQLLVTNEHFDRLISIIIQYNDPDNKRLVFPKLPCPKRPRAKHQKFVDYVKEGYRRVRYSITAKVTFQEREYIVPGYGDNRHLYCIPDVVCKNEREAAAAIIQTRNLERTCLKRRDIKKIYKDLCVLENQGYDKVLGYIYIRNMTEVPQCVQQYAWEHDILIVREGMIDADELLKVVDWELKTYYYSK